jgi:hypothetical protein
MSKENHGPPAFASLQRHAVGRRHGRGGHRSECGNRFGDRPRPIRMDLELAERTLPPAIAKAEAYLDQVPTRELAEDLAAAQRTEAELAAQLEQARPVLAALALWTSVLETLAMIDPDPVRRFRNQYDAGNYHAAIETPHQIDSPLTDARDIER